MANFLNTSATNYFLEELIKGTREWLNIISPFLKFNDRIKELLEDKDRMKIYVRIVYGKSELPPEEITWLRSLEFVRTSFCKNLHAKCYMNESSAIITSMNLYDFSQVNNNEMGVFVSRESEPEFFKNIHDEVQRLIRVSDEVRLSAEKIKIGVDENGSTEKDQSEKLPTYKLAEEFGIKTPELLALLVAKGLLTKDGDQHKLTDLAKKNGCEFKISKSKRPYCLWPRNIKTHLEEKAQQ